MSTESVEPDATGHAPDAKTQTCNCGKCGCTFSCADVSSEPTQATRLIITAMALICSTIAMGCNLAVIQPLKGSAVNVQNTDLNAFNGDPNGFHWIWSNEDKVLVAAFCFTAFLFILAMFVMKGAPACSEKAINACTKPQGCLPNVTGSTHGAWRNTFALHSLVATILHLSFVVECADDQWKWRAFITASNIDQANNKLILCAIIFAAFAAALLGYLSVSFLMGKINAETNKNKLKDILCTTAGILTILTLTCWLHIPFRTSPGYLWFNSMLIAASCLAFVVVVEGIVFADQKDVGGSRVFTIGAGLASLLLFTFMVGAAVDMTMAHKQSALVIVVLVFSLANALIMCVLSCMSQWAISKQDMKNNNENIGSMVKRLGPNLLLGGILIFTIIQFSLAAGSGGFSGLAGATESQIILSLGVGCVFAAFLFHTVLFDVVARGFHIVLAALCYIVYFIFESYENTKWAEANELQNNVGNIADYNAFKKMFNTRVTALVFAALNLILLILAAVYFFFQMAARKVEVEEGQAMPDDDDEQ